MTQFSLGRRDSTVITSSHSPSESELVASSLGTSFFFFLVPFLGATFSHPSLESESVASSHVPFLGSCFFFLVPPLAMKHMGGGGSGLSHLMVIPVTSYSSEESSSSSSCSSSSSSSLSEIHSPT